MSLINSLIDNLREHPVIATLHLFFLNILTFYRKVTLRLVVYYSALKSNKFTNCLRQCVPLYTGKQITYYEI